MCIRDRYMGFPKLFQVALATARTLFSDRKIPELAIEFLVTAIERAPSLLLGDKMIPEVALYYGQLFEAILGFMVASVKDLPTSWVNPTDNLRLPFDDDVGYGQDSIDRVLACTRRDFGISLLDPQILKLFAGDWRHKYVALLAGARIGPFVRSPSELSVLIPAICDRAITSQDPRIRLGAVRALKNLAEEAEGFHSNYHKEVVGGLLKILEDSVGRLRQEGCVAVRSFIARLRREELDRYIEPLMKALTKLIDNDTMPVDEIALSTIGKIIEVSPETFCRHYYAQIMPILSTYLGSPAPKFSLLRARLIEVLTILAKSASKERFQPYFPQLARSMTDLQKSRLQSKDLQQMQLLSSWQRICRIYSTDLAPYIGEIMQPLIELARPPLQPYANNVDAHVEDYDEKQQALTLLSVFIECLGLGLESHAANVEALLIAILQSPGNKNLKPMAARSLRNLLVAAKGKYKLDKLVKSSLTALIFALKNDKDLTNVEHEAMAVKEVLLLLDGACFNEAEVLEIFEELMHLAIETNGRSILLNEQVNELDASVYNVEDNLLSLLGETIGALIRSHPNEFTEVFQVIYLKILKESLLVPISNSQMILTLTIMASALQHLTYARIPAIYEECTGTALQFASHVDLRVRSAALHALAASVLGAGQRFPALSSQYFEIIEKALTTPMPEQVSRRDWRISQERAVIGLSHVLCSQSADAPGKTVGMTALWLRNLPLKNSLEGKTQIDLLAQRMALNLASVTGTNGENLKEVLRVIGEVLDTRQVDKFSLAKLLEALQAIMGVAKWEAARNDAYNGLSKILQSRLNGYINQFMKDNY
eukprot:TRINITY_DN9409_c0_g4_i5.p1 TRINITY_DN9409_c0_g4~~TRINITY_DN9409_c0_g4_i5.p1  ORF type:complete len:825 (+),score=209.67 TRINITY_DN9409_c0_g4_i5:73-2547(+)